MVIARSPQVIGYGIPGTGNRRSSGHSGCLECARERDRRYYAANPEKRRERCRKYHATNRKKISKRLRKWRVANKEHVRDQAKKYNAENKEERRLSKIRYRSTPEGRAQTLLYSASVHAEKENEPFLLTYERVLAALKKGVCERTGIEFVLPVDDDTRRGKFMHPYAPSVDRIDMLHPYADGNVAIVIDKYNRAKADWTEYELWEFWRKAVDIADAKDQSKQDSSPEYQSEIRAGETR